MGDNKIGKFEKPERISELSPKETLLRAGFKAGMKLCDIGAGTGIFSFPATEISKDDIYALEISEHMIEILTTRKIERNIENLKIKKVDSSILPIKNNTCDMALMVTVLHEIKDKDAMLREIKRILKMSGKLMIIEFHRKETPMGPPVEHRISEQYVEEICSVNGFKTTSKFPLGDNFYAVICKSS